MSTTTECRIDQLGCVLHGFRDPKCKFFNYDDEPFTPRAGERERVILNSDLVVRPMPNTPLKTKYLLTTDDDWPVAEFYREEEAEGIAYEHNQHATLIEQRERLVDLLRYLKDTAFAVHVNDKHKPEAFAICEHIVCQRACQAWNEYLEKIAAATIEQEGEASR